MKFDFNALKAKMMRNMGVKTNLQKRLGTSEIQCLERCKAKRHFHEMISLKYAICINIPKDKVGYYFFTEKV